MSDQNAALFDKLDGFYVTKSEHDWLERRFSNMTEKEKILFQGAMELEKPQEIGHVMRIASQLDCYDLFYGAGDEAALGKFVMESIECSSDAARPFLNAEHLGAAYHQSQNGAFCTGHYVRNIKLADPFVEEDPTLQPVAGDYAIRVKLASRSNMEGIWVGFPDSGEYIDSNHPDELLLGLDSLQAESLSECIALEVDCCLPQLTGILDQYDSASELVRHAIDFGYVWAEQGQGKCEIVGMESAILYEAGFQDTVDAVIMVYAPVELRIQRAMYRDGASEEQVRARIAAQMDDEEKRRRADFTVVNDGVQLLIPQLNRIVEQLKTEKFIL